MKKFDIEINCSGTGASPCAATMHGIRMQGTVDVVRFRVGPSDSLTTATITFSKGYPFDGKPGPIVLTKKWSAPYTVKKAKPDRYPYVIKCDCPRKPAQGGVFGMSVQDPEIIICP